MDPGWKKTCLSTTKYSILSNPCMAKNWMSLWLLKEIKEGTQFKRRQCSQWKWRHYHWWAYGQDSPDREPKQGTKFHNQKSETLNKSFPGADPTLADDSHASETLASGVKSRNDQYSMVKSAIKKIDSNSDIISIFPKGDKPLSIVSKESRLAKLTKQTGHTGKLLTTETFPLKLWKSSRKLCLPEFLFSTSHKLSVLISDFMHFTFFVKFWL